MYVNVCKFMLIYIYIMYNLIFQSDVSTLSRTQLRKCRRILSCASFNMDDFGSTEIVEKEDFSYSYPSEEIHTNNNKRSIEIKYSNVSNRSSGSNGSKDCLQQGEFSNMCENPNAYGKSPNWDIEELPYGCTKYDIHRNLTDDEILGLTEKLFFSLSKRKAFIIYYYYWISLKRKYLTMVNTLERLLIKQARENKLSIEHEKNLWSACKEQLIKDLISTQLTCEKLFFNFMRKRRKVWTIPFEILLFRCSELVHGTIRVNMKKWNGLLEEKVKKYAAIRKQKDIIYLLL
ncbi:RAD protein [Plasmodium gonderi]|uniref:RAD protein n=1 Tax=Plasmodium gonderi TaxID=77519 RepID=A0A1Y1JB25_PLAGO|nr:RAD protein [Plasmodium gonderi]GAW79719.1 RAD protein [Plasmodium gonderi]